MNMSTSLPDYTRLHCTKHTYAEWMHVDIYIFNINEDWEVSKEVFL